MGKVGNTKQLRIDAKHRFPLRVSEVTHSEVEAVSFRHNLSLNLLYCEAIDFAITSPSFFNKLQEKYKRDERRGHFVYHQDTTTLRKGRIVEEWDS